MVRQKKGLSAFSIPIVVGFEYDWVLALNGDLEINRLNASIARRKNRKKI